MSSGENSNKSIGKRAESKALNWFRLNGYLIKESNWQNGHKEVDLIVENEKFRIFVEVKFNSDRSTNFPESKVNKLKRNFLRQCARSYNLRYPTKKQLRFDILAITQSEFSIQIFHLKDAFLGRALSMKYLNSPYFYI